MAEVRPCGNGFVHSAVVYSVRKRDSKLTVFVVGFGDNCAESFI
jgi:hypothetical protein